MKRTSVFGMLAAAMMVGTLAEAATTSRGSLSMYKGPVRDGANHCISLEIEEKNKSYWLRNNCDFKIQYYLCCYNDNRIGACSKGQEGSSSINAMTDSIKLWFDYAPNTPVPDYEVAACKDPYLPRINGKMWKHTKPQAAYVCQRL